MADLIDYKPNFGGAAAILQAAANVIAVAERERLERLAAKPVAWVRRHPDGTLTGELLLDSQIEQVRKDSGAWVPLVPAPPPGVDVPGEGKTE